MVLSVGAVMSFMESGMDCPAPNHPDDMYLGAVAKKLEWGVVHSPLFHQVRIKAIVTFPECNWVIISTFLVLCYTPYSSIDGEHISNDSSSVTFIMLQSQPPTFPERVLQLEESISFHRHAPLDPGLVYTRYLLDHTRQGGDKDTTEQITRQDHKRVEL